MHVACAFFSPPGRVVMFSCSRKKKGKREKRDDGEDEHPEDVIVETIEEKLLVIDSIYPFVTFNWRTTIRQGT